MPAGIHKHQLALPAIDVSARTYDKRHATSSWPQQQSIAHVNVTDLSQERSIAEKRVRERLQGKRTLEAIWAEPGQSEVDRLPDLVTHETVIPGGEDVTGEDRRFVIRNNGSYGSTTQPRDDVYDQIKKKRDENTSVEVQKEQMLRDFKDLTRKHRFSPDKDWIEREILRMGGDKRQLDLSAEVRSRMLCGNSLKVKKKEHPVNRSQVAKTDHAHKYRHPFRSLDEEYDDDAEHLSTSLTLPRIEAVLRAEGIKPHSITQQLDTIRERCKRNDYRPSLAAGAPSKSRPKLKLPRKDAAKPDQDMEESNVVYNAQGSSSVLTTPRKSKLSTSNQSSPRGGVDVKLSTPRGGELRPAHQSSSRLRDLTASHTSLPTPRESLRASVIEDAQNTLSSFITDIEQTRWLSHQGIEKGGVPEGFVAPRVLVISSKVPNSAALVAEVSRQERDLLVVPYDFETATYQTITDDIRKKLDEYHEDCKMKSILIYCQGGPGYLYLIKRKVVTPQKLLRKDQADLMSFWKCLGDMISKLEPKNAFVHFMGCDLLGSDQGLQLFTELKKIMHPTVVNFNFIDETSHRDKDVLQLYFDYDKYMNWKGIKPKRDDRRRDAELDVITEIQRHNAPALDNG